jgi:hypothetical protein
VETEYDYDVALSFAGEDRDRAEELAHALKRRGVRVFYDRDEAARRWGENLFTHLSELYLRRARYCIPLLSRHYVEKPWTRHELAAAQARAFAQKEPYLLPVRLDDTDVPGLLPTVRFVTWADHGSDTITELVLERLRGAPAPTPAATRTGPLRWIELQPDYVEAFDIADAAVDPPDVLDRAYASVWLPGEDEVWSSTVTAGTYKLTNRTQAAAVRYIHLRIADRDMGEAPVSVEVRCRDAANASGAGILYRFDRTRRHYLAFVAGPGDQYRLGVRDERGFRFLHAGRHAASTGAGFHRLGIAGSGGSVELYVDDRLVRRIDDGGLRHGDTGIVAIGTGEFDLDNFSIYK